MEVSDYWSRPGNAWRIRESARVSQTLKSQSNSRSNLRSSSTYGDTVCTTLPIRSAGSRKCKSCSLHERVRRQMWIHSVGSVVTTLRLPYKSLDMSYKFPFPLNESYFYRQVTDYRTLRQFTDTFYTASYHPSHKVTLVVFFCYLGEPFTLSWPSMLPKNKVHPIQKINCIK